MLKLSIFILEDSQERIDYFKKTYSNHDVIIFTEVGEDNSIHYVLKKQKFDLIFLDHDLESHHKMFRHSQTGYDVAKFLVENNLQKQAIIYVHSMNPVGGNNIVKLLDNAGYEVQWIPFHLLKQGDRNENKS